MHAKLYVQICPQVSLRRRRRELHIRPSGVWESVQVGFNVELGGYFSTKRNTMSIDGNTFVQQSQVVGYCKAVLEVFR